MISPKRAAAALLELSTATGFIDWEDFYNRYPELKQYDIYLGTRTDTVDERK